MKCLKEWVTRVRGEPNDSVEKMMMMMIKVVRVMDVADVQVRVESNAGQKIWTPQRKGKQGQNTSLGFSINGCQNACKQLLICTNRGWPYTGILTWPMHLGVLNNTV